MTFSERTGIEPELVTAPPISEDAPEPFRKAAIKASVDALGWDVLRQVAIDAIRGELPHDMTRWYHDWDKSDDALMNCPWWMFYDIIEAVSLRKDNSVPFFTSLSPSSLFGGPTLEDFRSARRESREYVQRINTLFRIHNIAYSLLDNEIVSADLDEVQHHVSKALPVAKPSEVDRIREAWGALNSRPDPKLKLAVEQMRGVFENVRADSWLPKHIDHSKESNGEAKPMAWHISEAVHHAYRAASKVVHQEDTPTKADAVLSIMLGTSLVVYRDALEEQPAMGED